MLPRRVLAGWRQFWNGAMQARWDANTTTANNGAKVILEEERVAKVLRENFPKATFIEVNDVSGGCGAMFEVSVESEDFKGLSVVKQHQLVTKALSTQIKEMHGIRIQTMIPSNT